MKTTAVSLLLFMASCHLPELGDEHLSKGLSPKRQRQKISQLQKKLEHAEIDQTRAKEQVEILRSEIENAELSYVKKVVFNTDQLLRKLKGDPDGFTKRSKMDLSTLFLQEREILQRLVESGPSPAALEAQGLLDEMLRMITHLSDDSTQFTSP